MSTLSGLLLRYPEQRPFDAATPLLQANQIQGGRTTNETALLQLADLKAKQQAEQEYLRAIQQNPALAQQLFGGSVLGSLGPGAPAVPPGGALTQQPFGPTGAPGPAQVVPGGQDLSQFATQGGPPQSSIALLGPQPQGPMHAPQNPLLEMARTNPRAAMMLQQQMQGQQDRQWKMQEQQLGMGVKVAEFVARELQGVTDQASLDQARERIRQVHPQAATQVPQMYNKEAVESVQQRGIAVAQRATDALASAQARHADVKTQFLPKLFEDAGAAPAVQGPTGEAAPTTGLMARPAPPEYESAITEANKLFPQVSTTRIKSIIAAESNFDAKAVSPAGAQGPMQLMPGTAKEMGVDDPFDVTQNVRGGTRYYAHMLAKYGGDERKALTAYNWGPGNLDNAGGDVTKAPAETKAYVAKVLGGGGGAGTGTALAPGTDPRIAGLKAQIATEERKAQQYGAMGYESNATQANNKVQRLTAERTRLLEEARRQQERADEPAQAAKKQISELEAKQQFEQKRQAGPLLPEDRRKHLAGLRENVLKEPTFKIYQDVRNGYQNVKVGATSDSAQGDLAIFNGLAKILDPTSSVMSGEAKNIEDAQGQLQIWFNSPAKFLEGDRISKENRPRFLKMAHELAKEKLTTAQTELKTVWGPLAQEVGIDFNQVVPLPDLKPLAMPTKDMTLEELEAERARIRGG